MSNVLALKLLLWINMTRWTIVEVFLNEWLLANSLSVPILSYFSSILGLPCVNLAALPNRSPSAAPPRKREHHDWATFSKSVPKASITSFRYLSFSKLVCTLTGVFRWYLFAGTAEWLGGLHKPTPGSQLSAFFRWPKLFPLNPTLHLNRAHGFLFTFKWMPNNS